MDKNSRLEMAYKFCSLLKNEAIKEEIKNNIIGYDLVEIEFRRSQFECTFLDKNKNTINLTLNPNMLSLIKHENGTLSRVSVMEDEILRQVDVEKRRDGVIFTEIEKQFSISECFRNKSVLVDLCEKRYVFKNDNFLFNNDDIKNWTLMRLLFKFSSASIAPMLNLETMCDLFNCFSTHMNYYVQWEGGRKLKDNIYPTKTYLNGEEVSSIFDVNDGPDKLYRVYDLYRGVINSRNENDINLINLGFLSQDAFDFRTLRGITEEENFIVGPSLISVSDDYINYLKELFDNKFGYKGELTLNRSSILNGITYQMSGPELAKREIERKLGIPYEEYEKLDIEEQHKLIEQKTGKKVKPDNRLYIDDIPMDDKHIITRDKIDKRIEEITESGPKRLLKRIFKIK